jgi:hypothetical protein
VRKLKGAKLLSGPTCHCQTIAATRVRRLYPASALFGFDFQALFLFKDRMTATATELARQQKPKKCSNTLGYGTTGDTKSAVVISGISPFYTGRRGSAYFGDSQEILPQVPDDSVDLIFTSPPYALEFKKAYGNAGKDEYVSWFLTFARQFFRILKPEGSFVLNIGGSCNKGAPTRSLYHFKLLIALVEEVGFHLAQECFWYNPAKLPMPAEWVTVRRIRIKDSVEYLWWLSKTAWPKADNRKVLRPYGSFDLGPDRWDDVTAVHAGVGQNLFVDPAPVSAVNQFYRLLPSL